MSMQEVFSFWSFFHRYLHFSCPKVISLFFLSLKPVSKLQNICFINTVKISIIFFFVSKTELKSQIDLTTFSSSRHYVIDLSKWSLLLLVLLLLLLYVKSSLRSDDNDCGEQNWDQIKWRSLKSAATAGLHQGRQVSWNKKIKNEFIKILKWLTKAFPIFNFCVTPASNFVPTDTNVLKR
jgi:hypothetical protein